MNARYDRFLSDVGRDDAADLHTAVLRAILSGSLAGLSTWLDRRHGPRSFASLFLNPNYPSRCAVPVEPVIPPPARNTGAGGEGVVAC